MHDGPFENRLLMTALGGVAREKAHRDRVVALCRQLDLVFGQGGAVEVVRDLEENPGSVARARIAAGGATVRQVGEDLETLLDDLVRRLTIERGDEPEPTRVVFKRWIVEPLAPR
jgi:hypothetical protein